ncbi:hypothetical protein ACIQXF_00330 [Lysinibacillus sp. NPDC097231]|uniref:hypothetical protein n=1 Tax=Lysinibacillus sp. NPDC097231 TaxID=3364142 RepID=UPI00380E84D7
MRGVINNDKGYVLALVLIISILFTVIFFSFLAISSNTTKQNNIIEGTFQSQSIAEMGVSYFQHAMTNEIITKQNEIIQEVIAQRDKDIINMIIENDDYYKGLAINAMENYLQNIISSLTDDDKTINVEIKQNKQNTFDITPTYKPEYFSKTSDNLIIAFTSTGYAEAKHAEIKGTITVDFSNMIEPKANHIPKDTTDLIADPGTKLKICPAEKKANLTNESCQIDGSVIYQQNENLTFSNAIYRVSGAFMAGNLNNSRLENSTIYILGSMTSGNLNSTNGLLLHVKGSLTVGNVIGSGLSNSTIEVGGSAQMGNIKLINSTMFIKGDASIDNVNKLQNSKICVNGDLQIGQIKSDSNKISIYAKTSNNPMVNTDNAAFEAACTGGGSSADPGSINYTTDYEYSY